MSRGRKIDWAEIESKLGIRFLSGYTQTIAGGFLPAACMFAMEKVNLKGGIRMIEMLKMAPEQLKQAIFFHKKSPFLRVKQVKLREQVHILPLDEEHGMS